MTSKTKPVASRAASRPTELAAAKLDKLIDEATVDRVPSPVGMRD